MCNRPLSKVALQIGAMRLGPVCAKRIEPSKPRPTESVAQRDDKTRDMFDDQG